MLLRTHACGPQNSLDSGVNVFVRICVAVPELLSVKLLGFMRCSHWPMRQSQFMGIVGLACAPTIMCFYDHVLICRSTYLKPMSMFDYLSFSCDYTWHAFCLSLSLCLKLICSTPI